MIVVRIASLGMSEPPTGHLELPLLAALRHGPAHGYAVAEELRRRGAGGCDLPEGTIYPELHDLERQGLIESCWAEAPGPRRRVYRLTRKGQRALHAKTRARHGALGIPRPLESAL